MFRRSTQIVFVLLVLGGFAFASCGGGGSSDSSATDNGLSEAYPTDLAITSPFAPGAAVEGLLRQSPRGQEQTDGDVPLESFAERQEDIQNRLEATSINSCGFRIDLFRNGRVAECYGPEIDYLNHPNGADRDPAKLPTGDVGIWSENEGETDEACLAAKINSLVTEIKSQVDFAVNTITAMYCMANVEGTDVLPSEGEQTDFTSTVQDGMTETDTPITISSALIERESDDEGGNAVYRSAVGATATVGDESIETSMQLRHIPTSADNQTYKGKLWYTISGSLSQGGNCGAGGPEKVAVVILYEKTSASNLVYRMQRAEYCSSDADPFDSNNNIDASKKHPDPDGWAGNFHHATFQMNPTNGLGTFSYAWQAGPQDGNTRTFIAELSAEDNTLGGCGYYGYGPDISSASVGDIDGMICNWAGPGAQHNPIEKVQRQCVEYDETQEIFVSSSSQLAITYAPTNSCNSPGNPFQYEGPDGEMVTGEVTNNLVALSSVDITPPSPPTDL